MHVPLPIFVLRATHIRRGIYQVPGTRYIPGTRYQVVVSADVFFNTFFIVRGGALRVSA